MSDTNFIFEDEGDFYGKVECVDLNRVARAQIYENERSNRTVKLRLYDSRNENILSFTIFKQTFDEVGSLIRTTLKNIDKCKRLLRRLEEVGFYSEERHLVFLNRLYEFVEEKYDRETTKMEKSKESEVDTELADKNPEEVEEEIESLVKDISELSSE